MVNVYYLQWFGPFPSVDELKKWRQEENEECYLYLLQGKKKWHQKYTYYCGQTFKQNVEDRLSNSNHHIRELQERSDSLRIWVGSFGNIKNPTKDDVNLCEKMLTSEMMQIEVDDAYTANKTNLKSPNDDVIIVNEWFDLEMSHRERTSKISPANRVPDVISYWSKTKEVFVAKHLKKLGPMK